jgi:hypothetical protein
MIRSHPLQDFVMALHNKGYTPYEIKLLCKNDIKANKIYYTLKKNGIIPRSEPKTSRCVMIECPGFKKLYSTIYPKSYKYCPYCGNILHLTRTYKHKIMVDAYGNKIE